MKQELVIPGLVRLSSESPPPPGWQTPYFYMIGSENYVMVDAGYKEAKTFEKLREILGYSSRKLVALILTHGHTDHAGEIKEIKDAFYPQVIAHRLELPILKRRNLESVIDRWIDGDFEIETELGKLKAVFTPGHSPGHLSFYLENKGILFSGDLVVGEGTSFVGPPDGDMMDYMESLKRVQALKSHLILPGHGPLVRDTEKHLKDLIEHRELREYQILRILSRGKLTTKELVREIYAGLIHPALLTVAEITVLGHLNKLEKEGKVIKSSMGTETVYSLVR